MEEYAPEIVYIKGIHNTVTDAISRLEYNPVQNLTNEYSHSTMRIPTGEPTANPSQWMTLSKHWRRYMQGCAVARTDAADLSAVFANCSEEDDIYPLTTVEIAEAQWANASIKHLFKRNAIFDKGSEVKLIENTLCVCKEGRLVIPKPLQRRAELWYHHSSATPWAHPSRRDDERCDVLERYAYHYPVSNSLPNQQETDSEIRASTPKIRHKQPLGMFMC